MTQTILEKINNSISQLQAETESLRSFVIGILGRDEEGGYNPDFAAKILKAVKNEGNFHFKDKISFLKKLRS